MLLEGDLLEFPFFGSPAWETLLKGVLLASRVLWKITVNYTTFLPPTAKSPPSLALFYSAECKEKAWI